MYNCAVILCGGEGSRLKSIFPNIPKSLVRFNGIPFIEILVNYFRSYGINKIILATGYKSELIEKTIKEKNIIYSIEKEKLGTGGAIKNALKYCDENFFISNGDSLCDLNLFDFYNFHLNCYADLSVGLSDNNQQRKDVGCVSINKKTNIITNFYEKKNLNINRLINSGIYIANKKIFLNTPNIFSFESFLIPKIIMTNKIFGFRSSSDLYDFGTPERYKSTYLMISNFSKKIC